MGNRNILIDKQEALSIQAAEKVVALIKAKPNSNIGFPTGRTPTMMYQSITRLSQEQGVDWSSVQCFALDEYLDVQPQFSFQTYLETHLYSHVGVPKDNQHNPALVDDYDDLIEVLGGLDLAILGIGGNGHIAFNEPGTPHLSFTQCIWLQEASRKVLAKSFGSIDQTPQRAVTMGISTILASRAIIMLAFGEEKKEVLKRAFSNGVDPELPASYLTLHNDVTVLTDIVRD